MLNNASSRAREADERWPPANDTVLVDFLANLRIIVREYADGVTFEVAQVWPTVKGQQHIDEASRLDEVDEIAEQLTTLAWGEIPPMTRARPAIMRARDVGAPRRRRTLFCPRTCPSWRGQRKSSGMTTTPQCHGGINRSAQKSKSVRQADTRVFFYTEGVTEG